MRHQTPRNSADRHASGMSRSVVEQVDDSKLWQEGTHSLFANEQQDTIEHVHPYGFTSVVQPPTGSGIVRKAAEAIFSFLGGGRSHGVAMLIGDRRFRLYNLANGEVAVHDDQGQQVHFKRNGIWGSVPNSKQIVLQVMDDDTLPQAQGSQGGQVQQAGRAAQINLTLDKNQFTLNHPNGAVNFNCQTFTVNASSDIKMVSSANMLMRGLNAIMYATASAFIKAATSINAKSPVNLTSPDWASPAADPPITD